MFGARRGRQTAREQWHPVYQRVYGIQPWQMRQYTLEEMRMLSDDLEKNGLGF